MSTTPDVTKWELTTDPLIVRRMGKTGEESAELLAVTTRIAIQGIDAVDPGTGKVNRQRLADEIGDVYAQLDANVEMLGLDAAYIEARRQRKLGYMREWEALYYAAPQSINPSTEAPDDESVPLEFRLRFERDKACTGLRLANEEIERLQMLLKYAQQAIDAEYLRACAAERALKESA